MPNAEKILGAVLLLLSCDGAAPGDGGTGPADALLGTWKASGALNFYSGNDGMYARTVVGDVMISKVDGTTIGVVGYVSCEFRYEIAANGVWSLKPDPKQQCPASGPGSFDYFDTGTLKQQGDILAVDAEGSECCFLSDIPSVSFVATLTRSP